MAADAQIFVIVASKDQASKVFKSVAKSAEEMGQSIEEAGEATEGTEKKSGKLADSFNMLGPALTAAGVIAAGKAAWELGQLGAQSLRTKDAFDAISGGAKTAGQNLKAMKDATRGAMSEAQMMASANQLMQMGLANNAEELENVTAMATRLGAAMGRDAGEAIESFSLMLANQSIPRLDTFGISAGKVRTKIAELQKETKGLTREQAFMQAVQIEGRLAMERLGDATEDDMLAFERLNASTADLKATLGEMLAPAAAEVAESLAGVARATVEGQQRIDSYREVLGAAAVEAELAKDGYHRQGAALKELDERYNEAMASMEHAATLTDGWSTALANTTAVTLEAAGAQAELATSVGTVASAFGEIEIDDETMWKMAAASGASLEELSSLAEILGIASSKEAEAVEETYALTEAFGRGEVTAAEYAIKMAELGGEIESARFVADQTTAAHEAMSDMQQNAAVTAGEAQAEINLLTATMLNAEAAARSYAAALAAQPSGEGYYPGYQHGTSFYPGGLGIVGESGPEIIAPPRGSQIYPNTSPVTQNVMHGDTWNITNTNPLAAAITMEQARQRQLSRVNALM